MKIYKIVSATIMRIYSKQLFNIHVILSKKNRVISHEKNKRQILMTIIYSKNFINKKKIKNFLAEINIFKTY